MLKEFGVTKIGHRIVLLKAVVGLGTPSERSHAIAIADAPSLLSAAVAERQWRSARAQHLLRRVHDELSEGRDTYPLLQAAAALKLLGNGG